MAVLMGLPPVEDLARDPEPWIELWEREVAQATDPTVIIMMWTALRYAKSLRKVKAEYLAIRAEAQRTTFGE